MVGLKESWCFCNIGLTKSERTKASIFSSKAQSMATISNSSTSLSGSGFLIHRNLLLTTHVNLPSTAAADTSDIRLRDGVAATLVPQRFFITSSVLDLTIVGLDDADGESNAQGQCPHYLKTCCKTNLELGSVVYLLGYTEKRELTVGEGKVVIATDNLIKLSTDGILWNPGSAGFDVHGNLAFMICDPMKLATSPNTKSTSTSSSSSSGKKDLPMQFGIPISVICDWLNQHWEGSLDDLNKPKLPLIRLMSSGPKSEHSCASFTLRSVFKSADADNNGTPSSSNKGRDQGQSSLAVANTIEEEDLTNNLHAAHVQGIPTPEIYESPRVNAVPLRKKENTQIQLLDINFPPRMAQPVVLAQSSKIPQPKSAKTSTKDPAPENQLGERNRDRHRPAVLIEEVASTGSVHVALTEVQSSSSPVEVSEMHNGYSSEGETTMYSAETAESRNYTSPREVKFQQVGRSQSCVSYNRWGAAAQRNQASGRTTLENQRSFIHGKKMYSQGATSHRSNDYFSPTVSSVMKRNPEHATKPRQTPVHSSSPRWNF
ncbi:hypothetical protein TanjilG_29005 [Lupinus angustifolius]|uniref:Uncharacterized protein n=1 Tax=Lupinus angustifolius TaxID=3871 RepID=A0A4P1RSN6_LUPAN|nr:PREDICTED: uncharacterized protein LOC109363437 [Lupinus angustifolius]OIW17655.1 hypothetical protein TanjilG_29005 [Lupinus angustifolius]